MVSQNTAHCGCAGQIMRVTPRIQARVPIALATNDAFKVFIGFFSLSGPPKLMNLESGPRLGCLMCEKLDLVKLRLGPLQAPADHRLVDEAPQPFVSRLASIRI